MPFPPCISLFRQVDPGNPPPLKGAKMWLHLLCHQSIQLSMSGYNLATSSSLLFNILYLYTVVTWHKSLMSVVNTCRISGPMPLAILVASFWKCYWHPTTLDVLKSSPQIILIALWLGPPSSHIKVFGLNIFPSVLHTLATSSLNREKNWAISLEFLPRTSIEARHSMHCMDG